MNTPTVPSGFGDDSSAPPPYNPRDPRVARRYPLSERNQKQWGVLTVTSAARSAQSLPLYYEGDSIEGSFETDPGNSDSIRSITISVSGSIVTGPLADDTSAFLHLSSSLWSRRSSTLRVGHRVWPFSISLPSEATTASGGGRSSTFRLPETFALRNSGLSVVYEVSVAVSRGLFRTENKFKTQFRYVPRTAPSPPSILRQGAYSEHTALMGPRDDPPGWETPVTVMAHGHVFKTRQAVVQCTLSLATPLSYTRGSVIPCWIIIESGDPDALELFASQNALSVRLRRRVRYQATALLTVHNVDPRPLVTDVASASWWPQPTYDSTAYTRTLEGEIRVPANLTSSGEMGLAQFSVSYTVDLFPSNCPDFTPADQGALLSMPVKITTMYPENVPQPIIYTPHSPDADPRQTEQNEGSTRRRDQWHGILLNNGIPT
ncbi:hypothetical protein DFH09DRAFT_603593 [Mycena vulgaris]|nr:hypothetical protein DFH09DRAFT_603593 [Mycena vulgaris]